ncbi:MAG: xanthine dehydrogenase family protein molybdopterin-binding subunit [Syntrophobacterales bacterium]|nr:MAG: xanthine dehydrogenase family protein molybdopterin-binding subunit [Syntrophobacterales bacterium]
MSNEDKGKWVGKGMKRKEDLRLLIGRGNFMDDIRLPNMKHAAILRSPYPHAWIRGMDVSEAEKLPGVRGILTGEDVEKMSKPFSVGVPVPPKYYACAVDKVRFVGEPVAVVVADDRYIAEDALDLIKVDYEPLPVVMDIEEATQPDSPILHDNIGSNIYSHRLFKYGNPEKAYEEADLVVKGKFLFPKYGSTPIETYAVIASYNPYNEEFVIYNNYQGPFVTHFLVALALGIPENKMRWIVPTDIGGGFGTKTGMYPYIALIALAAKKTGMTVKWLEDRREHLLASSTGTDRVTYMEAAVKKDGTILALKDKAIDNTGGYIRPPEPGCAYRSTGNHTGAYQIKDLDREVLVVGTNKCLTAPNRGYTCQELYFSVERLVDMAATELGLDPAEIRFKNFIQPGQFPYTTATGGLYDAGNYPKAFQMALDIIDYKKMREEQQKARKESKYIGIGFATVVDPSVTNIAYVTLALTPEQRAKERPKSGSGESVIVKMDPLGKVHVIASTNPQGQGHETVISQIVADELGIHPDDVTVSDVVDTHDRVYSITTGSYSSRFASVGTNAVVYATRKVKERMTKIAAHLLEANPNDLELKKGKFYVKGSPDRSISIRHVAGTAHWNQAALPEGMDAGLYASSFLSMPTSKPVDDLDRVDSSNTYGFVAEAIVLEVDIETGEVKFLKWASVHDSGTVLNPMLLEGQVMGSCIHALGGTLYEEFAYDENGQCLTASFQDYLVPTAMEVPKIDIGHVETASPLTALGSKGAGESSSMSVPVAIGNAIADALSPLGVTIDELPLSPNKIWHLIQEARAKKD